MNHAWPGLCSVPVSPTAFTSKWLLVELGPNGKQSQRDAKPL